MQPYHKINSVFKRDKNTHKLIYGDWSMPEFAYLQDNIWELTEKVDGTNIRIKVDADGSVQFGGRTDRAIIPKELHDFLESVFKTPQFKSAARSLCVDHQINDLVLYGEGYGPKIQKGGGRYSSSPQFVLFDIKVDESWLARDQVDANADLLGLDSVPVLGYCDLHEAVRLVSSGLESTWGDFEAEGVVARPEVTLFDSRGRRIITKIKGVDFK